jgi:hypothetical protein
MGRLVVTDRTSVFHTDVALVDTGTMSEEGAAVDPPSPLVASDTGTLAESVAIVSPGAFRVNEPTGYSPLVDHDFSTMTGWSNYTNSAPQPSATTGTDATEPVSPSSMVTITLPINMASGPFPGREFSTGDRSELYVSFIYRIDSPYDYHSSTVNKLFFIKTDQSASNNQVVVTLKGGSEGGAQVRATCQDPSNVGQPGWSADYFTVNTGEAGTFALGTWHEIEVIVRQSTGGLFNGDLEWWVDGTKLGNHLNVVKYKSTGDAVFRSVFAQMYRGGNPASDPMDATALVKFGHLYASGV